MRITLATLILALFCAPAGLPRAHAQGASGTSGRPLEIYIVDAEGGQATLIVSPSGESMLIDTGWAGFNGRDADRVAAAMKQGGVSRIDYLVVTHYHADHVGGVPGLAARIPIGTFVDHGATVESATDAAYTAYLGARQGGKHLEVKPGDRIPIAGLQVTVVASGGNTITSPLPAAGTTNPLCAQHTPQPEDKSENARSVGVVIAHGNFRMLNLGDLTWNKEFELACPADRIGPVDLYLTTHHGSQQSGPAALVHALKPRVAIMNNGANKGGSPTAWRIVRDSPGLLDFWQLHTAVAAGKEFNTDEQLTANIDESTAHMITVSAAADGSFTVLNGRNSLRKTYPARSGVTR